MSSQPKHTRCFDRAVLIDFALGKLPHEEFDRVAAEVETCPDCQAVLETLDDVEDSVLRDLKGGGSRAGQVSPELAAQIRKAEDISRVVWGSQASNADETTDALPPQRLGQYELLQQIGRGGMGTVWRAMHLRLKRSVAVKLLPVDRLRDPQAVARFHQEMEAVGRLDHSNLVRAHDAGDVDGQHYLVMELLDGVDLSHLVRKNGPLAIPDACEAVRQAALGLQYAHEHDLVHRDVKPSNLMLTPDGVVKVLDLGLARLVEQAEPDAELTGTDQVMGTGDYIAPEQVDDARGADHRADIYSLGCTLYYLLAGQAPFGDPKHPTFVKKVMAHTQEPAPDIRQVRHDVPEDLGELVGRLLAKQPDDRPADMADVADAVGRWSGEENLRKLAAKGSAESPGQFTVAAGPPGKPLTSQGTGQRPKAPPQPMARMVAAARKRWAWLLAAMLALVIAATMWMVAARINTQRGDMLVRSTSTVLPQTLRVVRKFTGQTGAIWGVAFSQDGRWIASGSEDTTVCVWDVATGSKTICFDKHTGRVGAVCFSPDSRYVASGGNDDAIYIWEAETGKVVHRLAGLKDWVRSVAFSPDGKYLASGSRDMAACLWNVETGRQVWRGRHASPVNAVAFTPDGTLLLCGCKNRLIHLRETEHGELQGSLVGHSGPVLAVDVSADGSQAVSAGEDQTIRLWNLQQRGELRQITTNSGSFWGVAISPDGSRIISCGPNGRVQLWGAETGREIARNEGVAHTDVAFSPDGRCAVSGRGNTAFLLALPK